MKYITQTGKKYNPPELILVNKFTKVKIYKIYKNEVKELRLRMIKEVRGLE